ncbi:hypothetical protein JHK85_056525 [Glycine max]|nr:hypothetical protein JHK85_056525 [Glycine max]
MAFQHLRGVIIILHYPFSLFVLVDHREGFPAPLWFSHVVDYCQRSNTKAHKESVVRMVGKEIFESFLGNLRLLGTFVRCRAVELLRGSVLSAQKVR